MKIWRVPYPKYGAGPGLQRVAAIADQLGLDFACFGKSGAAIVGSNGKGSTAAMTAALLRESGARVGVFTSPHLFALNERFNIDGEDISDEALERHWQRVVAAAERSGLSTGLGGFEFLSLIAADWFAASACDHVVWEAGIGGRLDPVRLIAAPRVALTSLDLEHSELLGATLKEIARDKIQAAAPGAALYFGSSCAPHRSIVEDHCAALGVRAVFVSNGPAPNLLGAHQLNNAALAIALARDLTPLSDAQIQRGLANLRWPGRLEVLSTDPAIVVDVGHTSDAVRVALAGFRQMQNDDPGILICGVSADKDAREIVAALAPGFATIICAAARHKGTPSAEIAAHASAANPGAEIIVADSVAEARTLALARGRAVYVAGGLFLAAEFRALHLGRDPAALAFF
jgi:dihydrofolate synthase/folylpolyglutamate synthase